jgi:peptide/nickel transport system permease protein
MASQAVSTPLAPQRHASLKVYFWRVANNYVLRRVIKAVTTIYVVITVTFFVIRLMPSNPVEIFIQEQMALYSSSYQEARDRAAALFAIDLNAPVTQQYVDYMGNLLRGDLGMSYRSQGASVAAIIKQFLPWTLFCVGTALFISFTLGVALGMLMAYRRETPLDYVLSTFASLVSSIPNYLIAIIIIVTFGSQFKILNIAQMRGSISPGVQPGFTLKFIGDVFYHASLPVFVYVLTTIGSWMLAMKSSTVATLEEDYVTVARARGLKDSRIMTSYVGRNASLPLFTQLAISIGFVVGGSVLIETIFVYQGIGQQLLKAINQRDYPVMQGIFLIITISVVFANLMADLLYGRLDPRIRIGNEEMK